MVMETELAIAVVSALAVALAAVVGATVALQVQTRNKMQGLRKELGARIDTMTDRIGEVKVELVELNGRFEAHEQQRMAH
jgi:TolA-binding protein